ncbi:DUF4258 domain-containing protein [Flavobacterium sp.]|uniref:DUF4258 domain-containing protein n=1 Tax=Flavobacterium sp. TaxID=239 RepID=UPI003F69EC6A
MSLRYRLAFYLLGLSIGIIFVYYFLTAKAEAKGVSFCYLPNCRVLKELRSKPLEVSEEVEAIFKEKWVTLEDIRTSMEYGDVDFSKSNIKVNNGKVYIIEGRNSKNEDISIEMINYSEKVVLNNIEKIKE